MSIKSGRHPGAAVSHMYLALGRLRGCWQGSRCRRWAGDRAILTSWIQLKQLTPKYPASGLGTSLASIMCNLDFQPPRPPRPGRPFCPPPLVADSPTGTWPASWPVRGSQPSSQPFRVLYVFRFTGVQMLQIKPKPPAASGRGTRSESAGARASPLWGSAGAACQSLFCMVHVDMHNAIGTSAAIGPHRPCGAVGIPKRPGKAPPRSPVFSYLPALLGCCASASTARSANGGTLPPGVT